MIDRIAYSPYGEATRTLRSDVNGDGFVNQSDHTGIIRPRNGATIGTAAYVVEADLNRNGVINQLDYDICIADDGRSSSGGVGEAGLFSKGVRNSVGYCGYIFNEDSGLYMVRFRTYSLTLGRWLERDPAGYVDGANLYEYVRGGAVGLNDPLGLIAVDFTSRVLLAVQQGALSAEQAAQILGISTAALIAMMEGRKAVEQLIQRYTQQARGADPCERAMSAVRQAERSIESLQRQIERQERWTNDPTCYPGDPIPEKNWERARQKWRKDIERQRREIERNREALERLKDTMERACMRWYKPWTWY